MSRAETHRNCHSQGVWSGFGWIYVGWSLRCHLQVTSRCACEGQGEDTPLISTNLSEPSNERERERGRERCVCVWVCVCVCTRHQEIKQVTLAKYTPLIRCWTCKQKHKQTVLKVLGKHHKTRWQKGCCCGLTEEFVIYLEPDVLIRKHHVIEPKHDAGGIYDDFNPHMGPQTIQYLEKMLGFLQWRCISLESSRISQYSKKSRKVIWCRYEITYLSYTRSKNMIYNCMQLYKYVYIYIILYIYMQLFLLMCIHLYIIQAHAWPWLISGVAPRFCFPGWAVSATRTSTSPGSTSGSAVAATTVPRRCSMPSRRRMWRRSTSRQWRRRSHEGGMGWRSGGSSVPIIYNSILII